MFSIYPILFALVLFLVQIPIKATILALKASLATGKLALKASLVTGNLALKTTANLTGTEEQLDDLKSRLQVAGQKTKKITNTSAKAIKGTGKLIKNTGKFAKNQISKTPERLMKTADNIQKTAKFTVKVSKATIKAVQLLIKALQLLLIFIKTLITFLISLGIVGIIILVVIVLVLLVAIISAVVSVSNQDSSSTSSYSSYSSGSSNETTSGGINTEVITNVDTSSLEACCKTMADWYIANINTYQCNTSGPGSGSRKAYTCDILNNQTVYDDCTGFSAAYASLVSGKNVQAYGSEQLYKDGQSYTQAGWVRYTISEIGGVNGLVVGDILVCNSVADSNCKGRHAEIYLGVGQSFGWGKIQSSFPSSTATLTDSSISGYIEDGGSHRYGVVYRYTGGGS